ncbi:MAG: hypothetical protein ACRD3V_07005, partial [Vicinamibacteria bacterium]
MAALSMVAFPAEPTAWKVIHISDEIREPYRVPAMRERVEEADERRDQQFKLFGEFRQANYDDLARIQRELRDDADRNLPPRLAELQRQWEAFREERRVVVASLREAEQSLEWEIRCIHKSLQREASPEDLTGETLNKEARVRVTKAEGEGLYVVTLTRYDVRNEFEAVIPTRWIITGIE